MMCFIVADIDRAAKIVVAICDWIFVTGHSVESHLYSTTDRARPSRTA